MIKGKQVYKWLTREQVGVLMRRVYRSRTLKFVDPVFDVEEVTFSGEPFSPAWHRAPLRKGNKYHHVTLTYTVLDKVSLR